MSVIDGEVAAEASDAAYDITPKLERDLQHAPDQRGRDEVIRTALIDAFVRGYRYFSRNPQYDDGGC